MKTYVQRHYLIHPDSEARLQAQFSAADFTAYVLATRSDRLLDLQLFSTDVTELDSLQQQLDAAGAAFVAEECCDESVMLARYHPQSPILLGDGLGIFPDAADAAASDCSLALHVPTGPAFGDGRHPTTQMLAGYLMQIDCRDQCVLDLGCGTGVLGLIASQRGARLVDFTDVDADAVAFTRAVCALNNYPQAQVWQSNLLEDCDRQYDLLIANIYADLLLDVLGDPQLDNVLSTGTALLSGISHKRINEVRDAATAAGFTIRDAQEQAWWHSLSIQR